MTPNYFWYPGYPDQGSPRLRRRDVRIACVCIGSCGKISRAWVSVCYCGKICCVFYFVEVGNPKVTLTVLSGANKLRVYQILPSGVYGIGAVERDAHKYTTNIADAECSCMFFRTLLLPFTILCFLEKVITFWYCQLVETLLTQTWSNGFMIDARVEYHSGFRHQSSLENPKWPARRCWSFSVCAVWIGEKAAKPKDCPMILNP